MMPNNTITKATDRKLLSVYYTAGYPTLDSTLSIAIELEKAGVDFLEIGFPYSDPVADGPVIQHSSTVALRNGMTLSLLFRQLTRLREQISIPVFLMGYFNPVLQYGVENFCRSCREAGINGIIIPDLPLAEYEAHYRKIFEQYGIHHIFLITPQTTAERIRRIDAVSTGFIYMLSTPSVTGGHLHISEDTKAYFQRIRDMQLRSPTIVGFGISGRETFQAATGYADGAIVGSAFVRLLEQDSYSEKIGDFIRSFR